VRSLFVLNSSITAFGGAGVTVWGCFSLNCKNDLYVIDGILRGQKYRDQILRPLDVPHFDGWLENENQSIFNIYYS
jgi:hypothetical protein